MTQLRREQPGAAAPVPELIAAFDRGRRFLVFVHQDPDLDCVGSQLALGEVLRSRGKDVRLWSPSALPERYGFMPGVEAISTEYPRDVSFDVAVALDTAALSRTGEAPPFSPRDFPTLINVDHHKSNEQFGTLNWVDPAASSVGEMLYDLFEQWGVELSRDAAVCLYASILTDTGGFAFSNTTARAFQVAGSLVERGADPFTIWQRVFGAFPLRRHKLLGPALGTLRLWRDGTIATMRVTQQMLAETGAGMDDSERFVQYPRTVHGVEVAVILREQPKGRGVRVGLRSNTPAVDVSRVASRLGGGGHPRAAGCTVDGGLDGAERTVVATIEQAYSDVEGNA